jgi:hypothetical protein
VLLDEIVRTRAQLVRLRMVLARDGTSSLSAVSTGRLRGRKKILDLMMCCLRRFCNNSSGMAKHGG